MTGAPGTARECFALAEAFAVKQQRSEVVPHENALCLSGQRVFCFSEYFITGEKEWEFMKNWWPAV